jgi:predicted nuclease of predicted toxin-antitoxin system
MKFLFDQNISHRILKFLPDVYANSTSVKKEGLINSSDRDIWDFAKKNGFAIVTQDADFNDLNALYGFPPKIVWIRTGNLSTQIIAQILKDYEQEIESFLQDHHYGCFEIFKLKK